MIWVRRVLAIPLMVIFVFTFILVLLPTHLSNTVGNAGFYNSQMRKARIYDWVYDNLTPAFLEQIDMELPTDFPIDDQELKSDMVTVVRQAFPPEWLRSTFEAASKQAVPYAVGSRDNFTITVDLKDRITALTDGVNGVVDRHAGEIYDYVTDELIVPAMTEELGLGALLPYGITLTNEEIRNFVGQAMPQGWAIEQFKNIINSIAVYVKGEVNYLAVTIDLADVKTRAQVSLTALADQKLENAFRQLSMCNEADFLNELATLPPNTLPSCRPSTYSYGDFKLVLQNKLGMTIAEAVDQNVIDLIPNLYRFNHDQLEEALGKDMADTLDSAREFIVVDQGRITEQDIGSPNDRADFDNVRRNIHTARTWLWALWLIPILLLVAIGFLCGRNWKSRLGWALGVLLVTCLILVIVVSIARTFVPDRLVDRPQGSDTTQVDIVMADKADEVAHNVINAFVSGLQGILIVLIVLSVLAIAGIVAWAIYDRKKRRLSTGDSPTVQSST